MLLINIDPPSHQSVVSFFPLILLSRASSAGQVNVSARRRFSRGLSVRVMGINSRRGGSRSRRKGPLHEVRSVIIRRRGGDVTMKPAIKMKKRKTRSRGPPSPPSSSSSQTESACPRVRPTLISAHLSAIDRQFDHGSLILDYARNGPPWNAETKSRARRKIARAEAISALSLAGLGRVD